MLGLPNDVLCNSILCHLSVRDLRSLDCAVTNHCLRLQLRRLWQSHHHEFPFESLSHVTVDELKWLHGVGAFVKCVDLHLDELEARLALDVILAKFPNLQELNIASNGHLNDNLLCRIASTCTHLQSLRLTRCESMTSVGIRSIVQNCSQLHSLYLSEYAITDADIKELCEHCSSLRHIGMDSCYEVTDASLCAVAEAYPHLQSLRANGYLFSDDGVQYLARNCRELRCVGIRARKVTSSGLAALWAANPNLKEVDLLFSRLMTDNDMLTLAQSCGQLTSLRASSCSELTDAAVIAVAERCPQLCLLDINYCNNITDTALISLGQNCHKLKTLCVSGLDGVTDVGISALADGCPLLQRLSAANVNITDAGVIALASGCRDLRTIDIKLCKSIGCNGISALAQCCPLLSAINISSCGMNNACLQTIAQHCRNLVVIDIFDYPSEAPISYDTVFSLLSSCRSLLVLNGCGRLTREEHTALAQQFPHVRCNRYS